MKFGKWSPMKYRFFKPGEEGFKRSMTQFITFPCGGVRAKDDKEDGSLSD